MLVKVSEMKLSCDIKLNIKDREFKDKVNKAGQKSLKDVVIDIANDAIKGSPYLTGNNRRSIKYEAEGLSGAIYSTSGYGGYLETGTAKMPARPYFKPALDRNLSRLPAGIKAELK